MCEHGDRRAAQIRDEVCVTVWRRLGNHLVADQTAGAGAIVRDYLLFPAFGKFRTDYTRQYVGRPARKVRDDETNLFHGILWFCGGYRRNDCSQQRDTRGASYVHR